jgi:hypothetical protein
MHSKNIDQLSLEKLFESVNVGAGIADQRDLMSGFRQCNADRVVYA